MARYKLQTLGVMIDMSRNSVMNVESLKRYLTILKKMGYNTVMLYTEDTYEVENEPYFGYLRGRYTMEEMREIDDFAASLGIEMIPCIQTLAHLTTFSRWSRVPTDTPDILLVDDDKTYEFIDHLLATLSKCFRSKKIHIGMDEANLLGRGRFLDIHGYEKTADIMMRHLNKVLAITKKYDYEPLLWSDMFFRSWNNGNYYAEKVKMPKDIVDNFPREVIPVYWDYYSTEESRYDGMICNHKQFSDKTWFACAAWSSASAVPFNQKSLPRILPALDACKKHKIRNIICTLWGDGGGECSHFSHLPALLYTAEYAKGNTDEASIKAKFRRIVGIDYDDFIKIDLPNEVIDTTGIINPSKYMLYSDCFGGFLDPNVEVGKGRFYADSAASLRDVAAQNRKFAYLFDSAAKLCDVLEYKYELGVKTRAAYKAGDKQALRELAENDYITVEKRLAAYHSAYQKQWFRDNKPQGFEVQDIRLGGLMQRLRSCRKRLLDYADGKTPNIPELEEKILDYCGPSAKLLRLYKYTDIATVNVY
jgi:hypothetical protein